MGNQRFPHLPLLMHLHNQTLDKALNTSTVSNPSSWIIDLGANDYMAEELDLFSSYTPCSGKQKVQVANGSLIPTSDRGNVFISHKITLLPIVHVPNMSCNLLSINTLKKVFNCFITFLPNHTVFFRTSLQERW